MLFQCFVQRLCSVFEHVVLLEENMGRNPEFYYNRFELADMDNSECKANFILKKHDLPELADALHHSERFCCSQRQKKKITKMYIVRASRQ